MKTGTRALVLFLILFSGQLVRSQDTRSNVVEPILPSVSSICATLQAQLSIISSTTEAEPAGVPAWEPSSESEMYVTSDTNRIQSALDTCPTGEAVELAASGSNYAYLIKPITIPTGVTLLVDGGVTVFGSRNPADYQAGTPSTTIGTCGTVDTDGLNNGCLPLISVTNTSNSGIMGYGIIDGRGDNYLLVNGSQVTYSWYDQTATSQSESGGEQNNPMLLFTQGAASFTLYKITLRNSPFWTFLWEGNKPPAAATSGLIVWDVKIKAPYNFENNDGIDPSNNVTNATIANSFISNGDDMIALSAYQNQGGVSNVTIDNVHTYSGLGVSIGEETHDGISNVLVENLYQNGYYPLLSNGIGGIQIKSSADVGGLVNNVTYENICQQNYASSIRFATVPQYNKTLTNPIYPPQYTNITVENVTVLPNEGSVGPQIAFQGYDSSYLISVTLNNVNIEGTPSFTIDNTSVLPEEYVTFTTGPGPVTSSLLNLANMGSKISGPDITYTGSVTNPTEAPFPCSTSDFQPLVGELFLSTSSATNLNSLITASPGVFNLNAVIEPASNEYPALTNLITFYDGTTAVGTATIGGNGTISSLTLSNVAAGSHTYTAEYPGDSNYAAFIFGSVSVTVTSTPLPNPTIKVTPSPTSIDSGESLGVTISITGTGATPTGSVYLTSGSYTSTTETLGSGSCASNINCSFTIPGNSLSAGTDTITANYSGDSNYAAGTGSSTIMVTQSVYTLSASTPASVAPPGSTTSTITGVQSSTDYTGTVSFSASNACSLTSSPSGAVEPPTCSVAGTITYTNGTASGSATASVTTYSVTTGAMTRPKLGNGKDWLGAGSGAFLALLVFFGIPARRRSWRSMLCVLVTMAALEVLASCGGGSSSTITTTTTTTAGSYIFTVSGTGSDPNKTTESATFTVNVN